MAERNKRYFFVDDVEGSNPGRSWAKETIGSNQGRWIVRTVGKRPR